MGNQVELIQAIKDKQKAEELTLTEMAERLGISISMLSLVYNDKRTPGDQFLNGVMKAYPELTDKVALFLLRDITGGKVEIAISTGEADV